MAQLDRKKIRLVGLTGGFLLVETDSCVTIRSLIKLVNYSGQRQFRASSAQRRPFRITSLLLVTMEDWSYQ